VIEAMQNMRITFHPSPQASYKYQHARGPIKQYNKEKRAVRIPNTGLCTVERETEQRMSKRQMGYSAKPKCEM
jgi:hypothetical protein